MFKNIYPQSSPMNKPLLLLSLLLISSFAFAQSLDLIFYHATGCHACAVTTEMLDTLSNDYELNITEKEVSSNSDNFEELMGVYTDFGYNTFGAQTPSTLINNQALVIGSMPEEKWRSLFDDCLDGSCTEGIYTHDSFTPKTQGGDSQQPLTLTVLIGAALVDSINPCTIAVMVMLLGVILLTQGRDRTLFAGIAFTVTVFVMYLLMGIGLLTAITSTGLTNMFFILVTIAALILSIMEINAYFRYQPGFCAVEMPMFLRPYLKKAMKGATSLPGVVGTAVICSLFLLPCSSGPYLMVLGMLAKSITMQALFYLVVYNLIFVLPMFAIVLAIYKGMTTVEDMTELRNKYIKEIHLVSGIILFGLFLLMVLHLMGYI
jgi:cytochrome c biogenesis protein CcdA